MRNAISAVLLLVAVSAAGCAEAPDASTGTTGAGPDGNVYVLTVEGMSCATNCAPAVKEALLGIEGVKRAEVSFEDKRAVVVMAEGYELTAKVCDKSFGNQGYFVSELALQTGDGETGDAPKG